MGPGDIVVCVDDTVRNGKRSVANFVRRQANMARKGVVYTVRHAENGLLWLSELDNGHLVSSGLCIGEPGFGADHFRPVNPNRIQVFRSLLVNPSKRIEVEA